MIQDDFVGIWRLASAKFHWDNGDIADLFGPDAAGMLIYGAGGEVSVQIMRQGRPAFSVGDIHGATPEQALAAVEGYMAYFGTFEVDETASKVTHHMRASLLPNWVGQDLVRFYEFAGNRLTLRTAPAPAGGRMFTGVLVWERL